MLVAEPGAEGRYNEAIAISDSLLANCVMSDTLKAYLMIERNVSLANSGDLAGAEAYADTLIAFGRKVGINDAIMQGEQAKGVSFRRKEMYDSALTCYKRGLDAEIADGNAEMEQVFADMLAILYTETNRLPEATQFVGKAKDLAIEIGDSTALLSAIATWGAIYSKEENYHKAISLLRRNSGLLANASPLHTIKYLTPLIGSYLSLDSIDAAEAAISRMEIAARQLPPNHQGQVQLLYSRSILLAHQGRFREQWDVLMRLDSLGTHGKTAEIVLTEHAKCLAGMGDYKGAYKKMNDAYAALDSTRHVEIERELSDLSVRYDTLNKEMEIAKLNHRHYILASIIVACVILLCLLIVIGINIDRRNRRRAKQERQEEYLRGLEEERQRLARELHDDVAGEIVGLQFTLPQIDPSDGAARLGEIASKVRRLSHELMPPVFAAHTLLSLLIDYVAIHNRRHTSPKLKITDEGSFKWDSLSARQCYNLYRIVQEAVNNALRHSHASEITITLDGSDRFILSVANDGVDGTAAATDSDGIGLRTISARATIIGADVETTVSNGIYRLTIKQL